jgi:hypothetical protein
MLHISVVEMPSQKRNPKGSRMIAALMMIVVGLAVLPYREMSGVTRYVRDLCPIATRVLLDL